MHIDKVQRRGNGTIDIDFQAFLFRRATNQLFRRLVQASGPLVVAAVAILVVCAVVLSRDPVPPGAGSMFVPVNFSLLPD